MGNRNKVFIVLSLQKLDGTIYAFIPVLAEITGKYYHYEVTGGITTKYTVLPYTMQYNNNGPIVNINKTNYKAFEELQLSEINLFYDLQECVNSCKYSNHYCVDILNRYNSRIGKKESECNRELSDLLQEQDETLKNALDYIAYKLYLDEKEK